jgi:copper(I)-binding protein
MRKYIRGGLATAFAMAALPLASAGAQAADYDVGSMHITQPWTRATPKGTSSGAGYLTVTDSGTAPDRLSCAGTDVAAQCQIHTMSTENGLMKMRPVEGGLEIKPGETVTLKPGGDHMMSSSSIRSKPGTQSRRRCNSRRPGRSRSKCQSSRSAPQRPGHHRRWHHDDARWQDALRALRQDR